MPGVLRVRRPDDEARLHKGPKKDPKEGPVKIAEFQGEYRFLSNFWEAKVELEGVQYPSVEHAYQAAKTTVDAEREWIRVSDTPGVAKKRGRKITLRPDWEQVKVKIMEELVRRKFQDPGLRKMLLETGDAELEEGNRWGDKFWGVDLRTGTGSNNLGKILMKIREEQ